MQKKILRYSTFDFPVYTVMDQVKPFNQNKDIKCGLYYIETTNNYMPLRGNGFYSQPMINYCLENNIISKTDIKYELIPSLTLSKDFFNEYINTIYKHISDDNELNKVIKQVVNSLVGSFNNNKVLNSKTHYSTDVICL